MQEVLDGRATTTSIVTEKIRDDILHGHLTPDTPLRETALATRYGVSRTPVREAFVQLIGEGILARSEQGSVAVFKPSINQLRHIYEIRIPLEALAIRIAVEENEALQDLIAPVYASLVEAKPGPQWARCHEQFHMLPCRESGRPLLYKLVSSLRVQSEPYIQLGMRLDPAYADQARADHAAIAQAIADRDAAEASTLLEQHLSHTAQRAPEILSLYLSAPSFSTDEIRH